MRDILCARQLILKSLECPNGLRDGGQREKVLLSFKLEFEDKLKKNAPKVINQINELTIS